MKRALRPVVFFLAVLVAPAAQIPVGFFSYDETVPGTSAQFDITNQTGPNSMPFPDSTWPVVTPLNLILSGLTVDFNNGSSLAFGASYFTLASDGLSYVGDPFDISGANPQPIRGTLTGSFGTPTVTLNDGSMWRLQGLSIHTVLDDPTGPCSTGPAAGCLQDGDFVLINVDAVQIPEPGTWALLPVALLLLFRWKRRAAATAVAIQVSLIPAAFGQKTIQNYANQCYADLGGKPAALPFPLNCTTGTALNIVNARDNAGKCLSPAWASTHFNFLGSPFQCFAGSTVQRFTYNAADNTKVIGSLLCKNENPVDNLDPKVTDAGRFDYVALILQNSVNGKSCWFTTPKNDARGVELSSPDLVNGKSVPDPSAAGSDQFWQPPVNNSAFQCWRCHDNGVWMNSPWLFNQFGSLENGRPKDQPDYRFAATAGGFGFEKWPSPEYVTIGREDLGRGLETCMRCHKIAAKRSLLFQGRTYVSNTYNEWLGYVSGGSSSPVSNAGHKDPFGNAINLNPAGSNADPTAKDDASWFVTHWMADGVTEKSAPAGGAVDYANNYRAYLQKLQNCMVAVGQRADGLANAGLDVRAGLQLAVDLAFVNPNPIFQGRPFLVPGCSWLPPPAPPGGGQRAPVSGSQNIAVGDTDSGLTLTAQVVAPGGVVLPTITNMPPGSDPVDIPSGSTLTLSWDPGSNVGCFVIATMPPGVTLANTGSAGAGHVGSGWNWRATASPQQFGPVTEPGLYAFDFNCFFQTEDVHTVTDTRINLNVVTTPPVSPNPPLLMTLYTAASSSNAGAIDYTSYANPASSYTNPAVSPGQIPQTDLAVTPSDNILLTWTAEDVTPGSCTISEIGGGGAPPIAADIDQTFVSLSGFSARVFRLACTDLNGNPHTLQSRIHTAPPVQLNVSTIPDHGTAGVTYVYITASGVPAGAVSKSNVVVAVSTSCGGAPEDSAGASNVISLIGTSKRIQFLVPASLSPGTYFVTTSDLAPGDADFVSGNCSTLTVQ